MPAMTFDPITRFEDSVQRLVEGGLARLFAGELHAREVAVQITRSMEDRAIPDDSGQRHAPDVYRVRLNSIDHATILAQHPDISAVLGQEILQAAAAAGLVLNTFPEVRVFADPTIPQHQVHISADHAAQAHDSTKSMAGELAPAAITEPHPDSRLLLEDGRVIEITEPVLNVGRQRDNQVILEDPSVSRRHAQIRLRFGHYTLFDLGSTGGTAINGQQVREAMLRSNDIITIGSQTLIYVENAEPDREDTGPMTTDPV